MHNPLHKHVWEMCVKINIQGKPWKDIARNSDTPHMLNAKINNNNRKKLLPRKAWLYKDTWKAVSFCTQAGTFTSFSFTDYAALTTWPWKHLGKLFSFGDSRGNYLGWEHFFRLTVLAKAHASLWLGVQQLERTAEPVLTCYCWFGLLANANVPIEQSLSKPKAANRPPMYQR